jgi:hypothetical protein
MRGKPTPVTPIGAAPGVEVPLPEPRWFAISYRERGLDRMTAWLNTFLFRAGPGGRGLVNGSPDGLVELALDPPSELAPGIDTLFRREKVDLLIVSLVDADGFIAAFGR